MKKTTQDTAGTSFFKHSIKATLIDLRRVLGEPDFEDNTGEDKTNVEWNMETAAGEVFTVYDWKEGRPIADSEIIEWHIGGSCQAHTHAAFWEIAAALNPELESLKPKPESNVHPVMDHIFKLIPMNKTTISKR